MKFSLGQTVRISRSNEVGVIASRAEYLDSAPQYQLEFIDAQGRAQCMWFREAELAEKDSA